MLNNLLHAISSVFKKNKQTPCPITIDRFNQYLTNNSDHKSMYLGEKLDANFKLSNETVSRNGHTMLSGDSQSGKTWATKSIITSFLEKNKEDSLVFIIDPFMGAVEYNELFNLKKIIPFKNSIKEASEVINNLHHEIQERKNACKAEGVSNIDEYENKTNKKLTRVLLVMEEFSLITKDSVHGKTTPKSILTILRSILRDGELNGITVIVVAMSAINDMGYLINHFKNKLVFKTSPIESMYVTGVNGASKIRAPGICYTEDGYLKFPEVTSEYLCEILKDKPNAVSSKFLHFNYEALSAIKL